MNEPEVSIANVFGSVGTRYNPGRRPNIPIHDWTKDYAGLFHDFHQSWSIRIKDSLNGGLLPRGLNALVEHRPPGCEPDVLMIDDRTVLTDSPVTRIMRKSSEESYAEKANRIVVKHKIGRTIAAIEIVSPGNKSGKNAFQGFLEKSVEFINSGVHLLVIDLFPPTKRDPFGVHRAIWDEFEDEDDEFTFPPGKNLTLASYNAGRVKEAYAEPVAVGDVLPDMPLFLTDSGHVKVPLEATYHETWSVMRREMQEYVETGILPAVDDEA